MKPLYLALEEAGLEFTTHVFTPEQMKEWEERHSELVEFFKKQDEQQRKAMEWLARNPIYFK